MRGTLQHCNGSSSHWLFCPTESATDLKFLRSTHYTFCVTYFVVLGQYSSSSMLRDCLLQVPANASWLHAMSRGRLCVTAPQPLLDAAFGDTWQGPEQLKVQLLVYRDSECVAGGLSGRDRRLVLSSQHQLVPLATGCGT